jgi:ketosteroid isomerase-like protein
MTNQPSEPNADAMGLEAFIRQCQDGLRHQVQGDSKPFLEVWSRTDDVTILGARADDPGVNGETDARTLRVTHPYRRERGEWRLIVRHANQVTADDEDRERAIFGHAG